MASIDPAEIPPQVWDLLPPGFALEYPGAGSTTDVAFAVAPEASVVVKRCSTPPYTQWLAHEYDVLQSLASTRLPVPRALGLHREGAFVESPVWLVMTRLPGEPLWGLVAEAKQDERVWWFEQLGEMLAEIHATPVPHSLSGEEPVPALGASLRHASSYARRHDVRDAPELVERAESASAWTQATLVHGDFTIDNVLADPTGITGVIDWGGASVSDPRWDITLALSTGPELRLEPAVVAAFFQGYRREVVPSEFRRTFAG